MDGTRLYDIRFEALSLSRPGGHAVLRFTCPACSRTVEEALPVFAARPDPAGGLLFYDCPLCSTTLRLEKKPLRDQAAAFYRQRLEGCKKVVNPHYVKQERGYHDGRERNDPEPRETPRVRGKKHILAWLSGLGLEPEHLEKWGLLPAKRAVGCFLASLAALVRPPARPPDPALVLQERYDREVLARLPWHLEENDAREALDWAKALRPLLFIRFGIIHSGPIGHLAASTINYVRERLAGLHHTLDYFFIDLALGCSNYALLDILSRMLNITPVAAQLFNREYLDRAARADPRMAENQTRLPLIAYGEYFKRPETACLSPHVFYLSKSMDNHSLADITDVRLPFTEEEEARAQRELAAMGLPEGAKLVCLHVRDQAYYGRGDWHTLRNVDINLYRKAAEHLASSGYYVLRTGAKVAAPLEWESERIIDYATRFRSEFMDVWLFAKADLTLTSGSGPDAIPYSLNHHVLCACMTSPAHTSFSVNGKVTFLFVHARRDGKRVPLEEFIASKVFRHDDYVKHGFSPEYNSPEEILEAVKEKLDLMAGGQLSADDMRLQRLFRTLFIRCALENNQPSNVFPYEAEPNHGQPKGLLSSVYLRQYRDELEAGRADWE